MRQFFSRVRRRTWIIAGSVLAVLTVTAVVVFGFVLPGTARAETIETTAIASLETMEKTVAASGTLTPLVDEDVSWAGAGTVLTIDVEEGSVVEKGDRLGTIDTLELKAALLEAKVTLADAKAQRSSASTSAEIAAADAAIAVAQAAVDDAADARDGAALVAPVSGVVTAIGVEVGDHVGGDSMGGDSTAAFHITGTESWQVSVTLGESDVELVEAGDQVELSTDDGVAFFGTVDTVGLLPDTSSGAAAYPVTIAVTGTAEGLFDGISVDATIVYERRTEVFTVPSAAVTTGDDGTATVTVVADDGTRTETTVTVGETSGSLTEILEGLAEGDVVLVASFTPGEGNQGQFPGGGIVVDGGTFPMPPEGVTIPGGTQGGGTTGTFPGGTGGQQ